MREGTVQGVALANGEECYAPVIASNADAQVTFTRLLDPKQLPPEFAEAVSRISYESASMKINVALEELPNFLACPGLEPGPHHRGTIHISPDQDYIERAFDDAKYGQPSQRPILECTIPSVVDPTVAPPGKHLMSIFVQYAPYQSARSHLGRPTGEFCRSLLRALKRVRAELSAFRARPPSPDAARSRTDV